MRPRHLSTTAALVAAAVLAWPAGAPTSAQVALSHGDVRRTAGLPVKGDLIASPEEVGPGRLVLLTGTVGDNLPRRVWLQVRRPDGWTRVTSRTTREDGYFRFSYRAPRVAAVLRFRVLAPASHHFGIRASTTPTRRVVVTLDAPR